ncbi:putative cardiolipin synthase YbhO [compost metagenome]
MTFLGRQAHQQTHQHPGESGFYPMNLGPEALVARLRAVRAAEKSLDLQYYIWQDDLVGRILLGEIIKAADRGVRVRLLLDDLHIGPYEDHLVIIDSHPNIEVRMFNPLANRVMRFLDIFRYDEVNRRMHNKSFIADNELAIVGGRNIANEYYSASQEVNFSDFDVSLIGPVVIQLSEQFDLYWNNNLAVPISVLNKKKVQLQDLRDLQKKFADFEKANRDTPYAQSLFATDLNQMLMTQGNPFLYWGLAEAVYDDPEKISGKVTARVPLLSQSFAADHPIEKDILLVTPYFIPGKEGVEYLRKLRKQGVRVRVLTNSLAANDVTVVFSGYKKYRKDLLRMGVELYELKPRAKPLGSKKRFLGTSGGRMGLHAKIYVLDQTNIFVGSLNLDPRSFNLNSEMGVFINAPSFAEDLDTQLSQNLLSIAYKVDFKKDSDDLKWTTEENDQLVVVQSEPEVGFWKKFSAVFLSIFVPESQM